MVSILSPLSSCPRETSWQISKVVFQQLLLFMHSVLLAGRHSNRGNWGKAEELARLLRGLLLPPSFPGAPQSQLWQVCFRFHLILSCFLSAQAVGEPPLFLSASVFYAIKDAIFSARRESGLTEPFRLDSPATPERIRNACVDIFTKLVQYLRHFQLCSVLWSSSATPSHQPTRGPVWSTVEVLMWSDKEAFS